MGYIGRITIAVLATALVICAPARAGEVIIAGEHTAKRVFDPAVPERSEIALGLPVGGRAPLARAQTSSRRGGRAVLRAIAREARRERITATQARRWRATWVRSQRALRKLGGARDTQLRYVAGTVEALALSRRLTPSRMPVAFLQLERNRQYWLRLPYPGAGDQVSFRGSQILFQYFPGEGLQLHPLSTFKKANHLYGFCNSGQPSCDEGALRRLLDEMTNLAVQRGRGFIAWEYLFYFAGGGGYPPWMSGMAQATGIQALGRAALLLDEPTYVETARRALGAFETPPPRGVRTTGPGGGVHYLQYSNSPRLYIFNAFLQSLIGLHDFGKLASDERATRLFRAAEPEARKEIPWSDVGDWSRYSYAGAESTHEYHELLREFLASMCTRRLGRIYCQYAETYRGYQVDPPVLTYRGPEFATEDEATAIRFHVTKLSAVELTITRPDGRVVRSGLATFADGPGAFTWIPRGPGVYDVSLAAKELRTGFGKKDRASGTVEVENVPEE
jgi:hypothetical protein